jgi:death-on-curing protein
MNVRLVEKTGEPHFVRDVGLLESGLMRPVNRWHFGEFDVSNLGAHLLLGIGQNHAFEQGNKRTALAAAAIFLRLNGYSFVAPDGPLLGEFVHRAITRSLPESSFFSAWSQCVIPSEEWEEFKRSRDE